MAKTELQDAIKELFFWQHRPDATNFTAQLYNLISKADIANKARLAGAFPVEFEAWKMWQESPEEEDFFAKHLGVRYQRDVAGRNP